MTHTIFPIGVNSSSLLMTRQQIKRSTVRRRQLLTCSSKMPNEIEATASGVRSGRDALLSSQMDAAWVDEYLLKLLLPRCVSMWKHLRFSFPNVDVNTNWLEALLHCVTLWFTNAQTPATQALGLRLVETKDSESNIARKRVWRFIILSVVLPTFHKQIVSWHERSSRTHGNELDQTEQLSLQRRRQITGAFLNIVKRTVPILRLLTLLSCWSGRSHAPGLALGLSSLLFDVQLNKLHPPLSLTYAHRRWFHEELMRTIRLLSPYSSSSSFYRLNSWLFAPFQRLWKRQHVGNDSSCRCKICGADPIVIPYITNCGHIFCYTCVSNSVMHDPSFRCRTCYKRITTSRPDDSPAQQLPENEQMRQ